MKIVTYNVNGIKARTERLIEYLTEQQPDVVCLQELKSFDTFPEKEVADAGYGAVWHGQKSWNGVAVLAKGKQPVERQRNLAGEPEDEQSRYLECEIPDTADDGRNLVVASIYLPNGNPQPGPKFDYKLRWLEAAGDRARDLLAEELPVVLAGDYNVIPNDDDTFSVSRMADDALMQPESREGYRRLLAQGWTDALRTRNPKGGVWTFWDYQAGAWQRDAGFRIDHLLLSPIAADRLLDAGVDKDYRGREKASDHAPTWGAPSVKYCLLALAAIAAPAAAQDRDLCTDRPGLGTPACTVEPGRVLVESSMADWTMSKSGGDRSDTILFGDTLVRVGVGKQLELQVGWTPLGYSRERTRTIVDRATRVGDVTLGTKLNFAGPDGNGFSAGVQVQATLPVGRAPIGAGDWGLSVILPVSYDLSDALQLQASPEIDAAVDEDGDGRHTAYGGTLGLNISISDPITVTLEAQAIRDRDPAGHSTQAFGGLSLTYQTSNDFQFDLGTNLGLNRASDDFELYAGISRRF